MNRALVALVLVSCLAASAVAQPAPDAIARLPVVPGVVPGEPGLMLTSTPSKLVCGGVRVRVKRRAARPADADTYAMLAITFPRKLDFDPGRKAIRERSLRRFNEWFENLRAA
jgi:hypothetical protein